MYLTSNAILRVTLDRAVGGHVLVKMIDGEIIKLRDETSAREFMRVEKLIVVSREEFVRLRQSYLPTFNAHSLRTSPSGKDEEDVRAWKRIARAQIQFYTGDDSWLWWCRMCSCFPSQTIQGLLDILVFSRLRTGYQGHRIEWLGLLRRAMELTSPQDFAAIRSKLADLFEDTSD